MAVKGSGLNYFFSVSTMDTGSWPIFYTFEEGAGTEIESIAPGQNKYTGVLSVENDFWIKPGSGFFSGNTIEIQNAHELTSPIFTHLFVYENVTTGRFNLLATKIGSSGYNIGITDTNRVFFETENPVPIITISSNNLSSKNLIAISYAPNSLSIGYYNFNAQSFETETFEAPFNVLPSHQWILGSGFTGFIDYYLYFSEALSQNALNTLASGFYNIYTGEAYQVETICGAVITGYQEVNIIETGITGYVLLPSGFDGVGDFTGVFPTNNVTIGLTGILSSGIYYSGITGLVCLDYTGSAIPAYDVLTGYANGFGMDRAVILNYVYEYDIVKSAVSKKTFDNIYNIPLFTAYSGYILDPGLTSGNMNLFRNGLAITNFGSVASGNFLFITGANVLEDFIFFDFASGGKVLVTGAPYVFNYTGQEIFFNGLNLISGVDFVYDGSEITLIGDNTGIEGVIFDYPIRLDFVTGNITQINLGKFSRNTSNIYINGLRQLNRVDSIEGSNYDLVSGNVFNELGNVNVYNNNGLYWE